MNCILCDNLLGKGKDCSACEEFLLEAELENWNEDDNLRWGEDFDSTTIQGRKVYG